ncbi:MAG TPA: SRPBCC domain-containing protein [Candidatus Baltobacteraceae bacterium]|nr:SRPBCC domain-containing protein [Candidatus Baltobacteraceae bacterium]
MTTSTAPSLLIRRTFDAPPKRLYEAFADPDQLLQVVCPVTAEVVESQADVRAGGTYRFVLKMEDGDLWTLRGEYRDVSPPNRLSMTWVWVEDDPKDEQNTLLTIDFNAAGSGTELVLRHECFVREESRNNHEHGWNECLDKIAARLNATRS